MGWVVQAAGSVASSITTRASSWSRPGGREPAALGVTGGDDVAPLRLAGSVEVLVRSVGAGRVEAGRSTPTTVRRGRPRRAGIDIDRRGAVHVGPVEHLVAGVLGARRVGGALADIASTDVVGVGGPITW